MSTDRVLGRVKWFNNRAGYGFITVTDGPRSGSDIFVHHSSVKVVSEQYRYLVQGEYVEFELLSTPGGQHEFQAGDVSGVRGGKLMCETRHDLRETRNQYHNRQTPEEGWSSGRRSTRGSRGPLRGGRGHSRSGRGPSRGGRH